MIRWLSALGILLLWCVALTGICWLMLASGFMPSGNDPHDTDRIEHGEWPQ